MEQIEQMSETTTKETVDLIERSDRYKLCYAAGVVAEYMSYLMEKVNEPGIKDDEVSDIALENYGAGIVLDYLLKLADEMKNKEELATLINEISK